MEVYRTGYGRQKVPKGYHTSKMIQDDISASNISMKLVCWNSQGYLSSGWRPLHIRPGAARHDLAGPRTAILPWGDKEHHRSIARENLAIGCRNLLFRRIFGLAAPANRRPQRITVVVNDLRLLPFHLPTRSWIWSKGSFLSTQSSKSTDFTTPGASAGCTNPQPPAQPISKLMRPSAG